MGAASARNVWLPIRNTLLSLFPAKWVFTPAEPEKPVPFGGQSFLVHGEGRVPFPVACAIVHGSRGSAD